ncbi:MAG: asparaginase [Ruminococcaceae bacterium]|nr:asparaginase [Oscillospiraceae bacterium]
MTERKKHLVILTTGGTIAAKASGPTDATGYHGIEFDGNALLDAIPGIRKSYETEVEQVFSLDSCSLEDHHLLTLSKRVNSVLEKEEIDGVVITHGTDTLEETAFFLNLTVKSEKPVVLTGAMRPAEVISADGPMNLLCAIQAAADAESRGKGVMVAFQNRLWPARDVMKLSTYHTDAFRCPEGGPLGTVIDEVRYNYATLRPHTVSSEFDVRELNALPRVQIVYQHIGSGEEMLRCAIQTRPDGIILACVGNGTVPPELKKALAPCPERPKIVRASRVPSGFISPCGNINDAEYRLIPSGGFSPQKARILLQLALTKTTDYEELCAIFDRY